MGPAAAISSLLGRRNLVSVGWACVGLAIIAVGWATAAATPDLNMDTRPGLLAAEQRLGGHSNALWDVVTADPADLNRDRLVPVSWWPPAQQTVAYWLRARHLTIGGAVKTIVFACWVVGLAAWIVWFVLTVRDRRLLPWFIVGFVLLRASHTSAFIYAGGDTLMWAVFPAAAVLNLLALRTRGPLGISLAVLAGFAAGGLVLIRYVGAILTIGFAVAWLIRLVGRRVSRVHLAAWLVGACAAILIAYRILSPLIHHRTPATDEAPELNLPVMLAVSATGPLLTISDAVAALTVAITRLGDSPENWHVALLTLAVGGVFLVWLVGGYQRDFEGATEVRGIAWTLGICLALVTSVALAALWSRAAIVSWETRHQQYGAFLLMPFLWEAVVHTVRRTRRWRRVLSALCLILFVAFPVAYGFTTLVRRAVFADPERKGTVGSTGVTIFWTAYGTGAEAFRSEVEAFPWFRTALLATPAFEVALTFPEHRILMVWDRDTRLADGFHGRPDAVAFIAPPWMLPEDIEEVRHAFVDVTHWTKIPLKSAPSTEFWLGR